MQERPLSSLKQYKTLLMGEAQKGNQKKEKADIFITGKNEFPSKGPSFWDLGILNFKAISRKLIMGTSQFHHPSTEKEQSLKIFHLSCSKFLGKLKRARSCRRKRYLRSGCHGDNRQGPLRGKRAAMIRKRRSGEREAPVLISPWKKSGRRRSSDRH